MVLMVSKAREAEQGERREAKRVMKQLLARPSPRSPSVEAVDCSVTLSYSPRPLPSNSHLARYRPRQVLLASSLPLLPSRWTS